MSPCERERYCEYEEAPSFCDGPRAREQNRCRVDEFNEEAPGFLFTPRTSQGGTYTQR